MATRAPSLRLRGREVELGALGEAFDQVALGHPAIVLVEGEAGIGKTRMLADALDDARARGLEVVSGRAQELERTRPFGVLACMLACSSSSPDARRWAVAALLATHLGDGGPVTVTSDPGLQFQAVDAFGDLVESLALHHPLVVAVDDLQWADPSSLLTLGTLGRRLRHLPVVLIGCSRALRTCDARSRPWTPAALDACHLAPRRGCRGRAGGRGRRRRAGPASAGRGGRGGRQPVVRHGAGRRARPGGSDPGRRRAGRGDRDELEDDGERLKFRHDLLREALYEDLPASVRVGLHREAGQRLAASGAEALQVAEHLARGAGRGDAEAVAWLTTAASQAAPRSPALAAELLERAVGLTDPADPERDRLLVERAGALMWSGKLADAETASRSLLDRDLDPSVEAPARLWLARTLGAQGRLRDTLRELERVQQSAARSDELRAGAGAAEAMARLQLGDLDGAVKAAQQARGATALPGHHPAAILAMTSLAIVEELRANLDRALQLIDEAVRLADQSPQRRGHQEVVHPARGNILMELDRLHDARATLQTGRRISERLGVRRRLPLYQAVLGMERFLAGAWDDAMAEFEAALALTEETGERHSLVLTHSVASLIGLHRGDLSAAEVAAGNEVPSLSGAALRCRGLVEGDPRILRSAVDAYARSARPLELALAAEDAGAGFARQGDADAAVPLLHQALDAYERLDAARDTARAEATLRDLGIHRGRRGPRGRPQFGWDSLTPTEHRVVDLAAEGLTNPQIGEHLYVSRRTVQTHLAHVFTKLGISSRTQLAAEATRRRGEA